MTLRHRPGSEVHGGCAPLALALWPAVLVHALGLVAAIERARCALVKHALAMLVARLARAARHALLLVVRHTLAGAWWLVPVAHARLALPATVLAPANGCMSVPHRSSYKHIQCILPCKTRAAGRHAQPSCATIHASWLALKAGIRNQMRHHDSRRSLNSLRSKCSCQPCRSTAGRT